MMTATMIGVADGADGMTIDLSASAEDRRKKGPQGTPLGVMNKRDRRRTIRVSFFV
jgi:hypothetical protein